MVEAHVSQMNYFKAAIEAIFNSFHVLTLALYKVFGCITYHSTYHKAKKGIN